MWRACVLIAALSACALAAVPDSPTAVVPSNTAGDVAQADGNPPPPCPPMTIAKGEQSGWHHDNPDFAGSDLMIRDPLAWGAFWAAHSNSTNPPPPVDFMRQVVIVTVQGLQPGGGGPNISIVEIRPAGPLAEIVIVDDKRPGPLPVITNAFHIVAVCRESLPPNRSVTFLHLRPIPDTGSVVGRVLAADATDQPTPLAGAHIVLLQPNVPPRETVTGGDGSYFFVNVPVGGYVLRAEHPDFEPAETQIVVPPNAIVAHDFALTALPPMAGTITGHVLAARPDSDPTPLGRALVQLFRDNVEVGRRVTAPDGAFVFEQMPPASYLLRASHIGFAPEEFTAELEVGGAIDHAFVLTPLPPPGAFVGRVLGLRADGQRAPIAGALVRLLDAEGPVRQAQTDRRGTFAMLDVPPGAYHASADAPGWLADEADVTIDSGGAVVHTFVLQRPPAQAAE